MKQPAQPTQTILWLPEEQLELWEISNYAEKSAMQRIERADKNETRADKAKKFIKPVRNVPRSLVMHVSYVLIAWQSNCLTLLYESTC